jgi:aquaporin related protein
LLLYYFITLFIAVADNYGVPAYSVYLFALTIWWGRVWGDATACPYLNFEDCLQGSMPPLETIVRTAAATFGGVAVFK